MRLNLRFDVRAEMNTPWAGGAGPGRGLAICAASYFGLMAEPTNENVLLALEPRVVTAAMQTTMMRASITAYSTAVGPSSAFRNDTRDLVRPRISISVGPVNRTLYLGPGDSGFVRPASECGIVDTKY